MKASFFLVLLFIAIHLCEAKTFLVFGGKTGWIGQKIISCINSEGHIGIPSESRLENRSQIQLEIDRLRPDFIINAAGVTGKPNVDWCESHKIETMRSNVIGALNLADIANINNIHMTNIGTGCIYEYDSKHPINSGIGFKEEDEPNFFGSFYSSTKILLEKLLMNYTNILNLRLRMPISSDLNSRNFITKITKYEKVINVSNSVSILDDLIPLIPRMALKKLTGIYNFTNPGVISHNEILNLYIQYIDPSFRYINFSVEEQDQILKAKRSNNELNVEKLLKEFPDILSAKESIIRVFRRIKIRN